MAEDLDNRRKRALWRASHRGTKELDLLIGGYAEVALPKMTGHQLTTFETLLDVAEPTLQNWLLAPELPENTIDALTPLVADIRQFHGLPVRVLCGDDARDPAADLS